jgi:hypothetical protein
MGVLSALLAAKDAEIRRDDFAEFATGSGTTALPMDVDGEPEPELPDDELDGLRPMVRKFTSTQPWFKGNYVSRWDRRFINPGILDCTRRVMRPEVQYKREPMKSMVNLKVLRHRSRKFSCSK